MFRISYYWERQKNGLYKRPISTFVFFLVGLLGISDKYYIFNDKNNFNL